LRYADYRWEELAAMPARNAEIVSATPSARPNFGSKPIKSRRRFTPAASRGGQRTEPEWAWDHPNVETEALVERNSDFVIEESGFRFNERAIDRSVSHWSGGFVKRIR
jgi:hypothetical protein